MRTHTYDTAKRRRDITHTTHDTYPIRKQTERLPHGLVHQGRRRPPNVPHQSHGRLRVCHLFAQFLHHRGADVVSVPSLRRAHVTSRRVALRTKATMTTSRVDTKGTAGDALQASVTIVLSKSCTLTGSCSMVPLAICKACHRPQVSTRSSESRRDPHMHNTHPKRGPQRAAVGVLLVHQLAQGRVRSCRPLHRRLVVRTQHSRLQHTNHAALRLTLTHQGCRRSIPPDTYADVPHAGHAAGYPAGCSWTQGSSPAQPSPRRRALAPA